VLVLRSGYGRATVRSRPRVAGIIRSSTRSVVRLERRGLRQLRSLGRAGRCKPVELDVDGGTSDGGAFIDIGGGELTPFAAPAPIMASIVGSDDTEGRDAADGGAAAGRER
jgi:hypothetical protein